MTKKRDLPPGVVSSVDDLAAALGYHRRTVQSWKSIEGFPTRIDGKYEILKVHFWKEKYWQTHQDTQADLDDMWQRAYDLIVSLREIQPELIQSLPESERAAFAGRLRDTIGKAIQGAFTGDMSTHFYVESYLIPMEEATEETQHID